ncbi:hypothetical protein BS50DRAFT_607268 [Corynespora cassiicola Philippines]|uniref:Uncharacterized protein n=1 Tax=Corynespora cassiicola Philippines TaxID=1448308 RepID=A0A2T2P855_CORCC|nr:hypothetical protein BS50DRAFT_607268 [Corynespora cassiicola Philippines]
MAPTPRKSARQAFNHTWHETDAALLDLTSLPVCKAPRAWERRPETKKSTNGKQMRVWRRYGLRSGPANTSAVDEDDEEHDSRSRPVKKLQRMSPKAMGVPTPLRHGKARAFKTTRWDRRKSTLPRKKSVQAGSSLTDVEHNSHGDVTEPSIQDDSLTEAKIIGDDTNLAFTFTMEDGSDEPQNSGSPTSPQSPIPSHAGSEFSVEQDATIARLFCSPEKNVILNEHHGYSSRTSPRPEEESELYIVGGDMGETQAATNVPETQEENQYESSTKDPGLEVSCRTNAPIYRAVAVEILRRPIESMDEVGDAEMSEITLEILSPKMEGAPGASEERDSTQEEFTLTEASLQLDIQQDEATASHFQETEGSLGDAKAAEQINMTDDLKLSPVKANVSGQHVASDAMNPFQDIAEGLTLGFTKSTSTERTPRRLRSPSPPPIQSGTEDATLTIALDDDTALLKDFLTRAAASKANKAATIARRSSLQNRRDSDVVRHALASPRKVLEDKDPNSPSKHDNEVTLDLSQNLTLRMEPQPPLSPTQDEVEPAEGVQETSEEAKSSSSSRRSSRARKTRLPAPPLAAPQIEKPKIAVRRADGSEHIVLKKTDAQELSLMTRNNTRKNKQGALSVSLRLLKLKSEAVLSAAGDDTNTRDAVSGKKSVRWDEQLAYFQEGTDTMANMLAEAESLATPDELSLPMAGSTPKVKAKPKIPKVKSSTSTPKIRRVKGLGTANGTPGKALLSPSSMLPDDVREEKEAAEAQPQRLPKPKTTKAKKMAVASTSAQGSSSSEPIDGRVPSLTVAPVGIEAGSNSSSTTTTTTTKERKSRLATPKKVKLPQPASSVAGDGKENQQRTGIGGATPKKGIPVPQVVIPTSVGMDTGLPRRRGKRV